METGATTVKCVHLRYGALINKFQKISAHMNFYKCIGLIFKRYKSFGGGIKGIKNDPDSDPPFGMKWHIWLNML